VELQVPVGSHATLKPFVDAGAAHACTARSKAAVDHARKRQWITQQSGTP
jgi:hypothetical protein